MTDTALANATKRRDLLAAEINSLAQRASDLKRDLAIVDAWIARWHEFAGDPIAPTETAEVASMTATVSSLKTGVEGNAEPKRRRAAGNPKKEDVAEAVRQIIQERGEPVSRTELFKVLAARGTIISSETDPEMVLSTMLWRMRGRVIRLQSGGYWLPEKPYPEVGYDPADTSSELESVLGHRIGEFPAVDEQETSANA